MRVACVLITHLRAKVELRHRPHLKERPAVIVERSKGRPLVIDYLPAAAGVIAGTPLEGALSRHTNTIVLEADEPSYQRVFHRVLTSLQGISDRVEGSHLGTAYVRLDGLEDLYGGEARLVSALLHPVPEYLKPRVGLGDAKFPSLRRSPCEQDPGGHQGPTSCGGLPCAPPHRPPSPLLRGEGKDARLRPAHHGRRGLHEPGPAHGAVRSSWRERLGPLPRH